LRPGARASFSSSQEESIMAQAAVWGKGAHHVAGIFISYRRGDSKWATTAIYNRLCADFDENQIFMDIDTIGPGQDFVSVIEAAVGSCDALIATIGKQWLTMTDEHGRRRLDNPNDFVRLEIASALSRNILVIPTLIDGAQMPHAEDLPPGLSSLARRNALEISEKRFEYDVGLLVEVLKKTLGIAGAPRAEAVREAPSATVTSPATEKYLSIIKPRFADYHLTEHVAFGSWAFRLVAHGVGKLRGIPGTTHDRFFIFAEFSSITAASLKLFTQACTKYAKPQRTTRAHAVFPVALVTSTASSPSKVLQKPPPPGASWDSNEYPVIVDADSGTLYYSRKTPVKGAAVWPALRKIFKEKLVP